MGGRCLAAGRIWLRLAAFNHVSAANDHPALVLCGWDSHIASNANPDGGDGSSSAQGLPSHARNAFFSPALCPQCGSLPRAMPSMRFSCMGHAPVAFILIRPCPQLGISYGRHTLNADIGWWVANITLRARRFMRNSTWGHGNRRVFSLGAWPAQKKRVGGMMRTRITRRGHGRRVGGAGGPGWPGGPAGRRAWRWPWLRVGPARRG